MENKCKLCGDDCFNNPIYQKGRQETIDEILKLVDEFMKDNTVSRVLSDSPNFKLIRIIPYQWEDFKKEVRELK